MASNKRAVNGGGSQHAKKPRNDAESQEDPSAFEMELAMFDEEMDIDFSQQSEGKYKYMDKREYVVFTKNQV